MRNRAPSTILALGVVVGALALTPGCPSSRPTGEGARSTQRTPTEPTPLSCDGVVETAALGPLDTALRLPPGRYDVELRHDPSARVHVERGVVIERGRETVREFHL